jgi:hypothetical protein
VLAVLEHLRPVDPHVADADGVLMRLLVGRAIGDRLRIEHDDVGELTGRQPSAILDAQVVGRQRGQPPDRFFERDDVLVFRNTPSADMNAASDPKLTHGCWICRLMLSSDITK